MNLIRCICLATAFVLAAQSTFASPSGAVDRGRLSLAWDSHEAGLFEEAIAYLKDIPPDAAVAAEAAWLYAECLYDLGRYPEAAAFLDGERGRAAEGRPAVLRDVYLEWAWECTRRGAYPEAREVAEAGLIRLPGDGALAGMAAASRFRAAVAGKLPSAGGRLPSGETIRLGPLKRPPSGPGWIQAFPWELGNRWIPGYTAEEWMKGPVERWSHEGMALWVRVPRARLAQELTDEAARVGLTVTAESGGVWVGDRAEGAFISLEELQYRAAVEGLGISGASVLALAEGRQTLGDKAEMARWLADHGEGLGISWIDGVWRLRDPGTGREFQLDPAHWGELLRTDAEQWEELWADLRAELGRPTRPFRCFCGRPIVLREVLLQEAGGALVFERGAGFVAAMEALCPLHRQYVTEDTAAAWGVDMLQLVARAREDAGRQPWDLTFSRDSWGGRSYLFLEGEGAAALARDPELLLGALEGVDGVEARGRSVLLVAPTSESLLITDAVVPPDVADNAAARSLVQSGAGGGAAERLGFRAVVHLPERGRGSFRMTAAE